MTNLRAIDGSKQAKALAEARIWQCSCGSRNYIETRNGLVLSATGKVLHKGTLVRVCGACGKEIS